MGPEIYVRALQQVYRLHHISIGFNIEKEEEEEEGTALPQLRDGAGRSSYDARQGDTRHSHEGPNSQSKNTMHIL